MNSRRSPGDALDFGDHGRQDGSRVEFATTARIDAPAEVEYFTHAGILQMVLRELLAT